MSKENLTGKERSLLNLKKFKKGNPGGPGRPKGCLNLKSLLTKRLEQKITEKELQGISKDPAVREMLKNLSRAEVGVFKLALDYMRGDKDARKLATEMIDGKAVATNINIDKEMSHDEWIEFLNQED